MAQPRKITNYNLAANKALSNYTYSSILEKPISSVYNIYINKEKINKGSIKSQNNNSSSCRQIKTPLYNNPFYSPSKNDKKLNYKKLYPKNKEIETQRNNCSIECSLSYRASPNREYIRSLKNTNTIHPDVYVRKNNIAISHTRSLSQNNLIKAFRNKKSKGPAFLTLTQRNNDYYYNSKKEKNDKNIIKTHYNSNDNSHNNSNNNSQLNNNHNIININLYNEKNSFIENNIINQIYMNKNRKNNSNNKIIKTSNNSSSRNNNNTNNNESVILTERKVIPRRTNYSFYYNTNNHNNITYKTNRKNNNIINRLRNKGIVMIKHNSKKKINNLPKVERKKPKNYNLSSVVKIQSVMRGYLLNKKLDKYLRDYARINEGIKILEKNYKINLFDKLKKIKRTKKYSFPKNILHKNNSNNNLKNNNNNKNIELQFKINELINEKKELQNNYQNLKEFIKKYKELMKENQDLKKEIIKLKQKNTELSFQLQIKEFSNYNKLKKYIIQKQNEININSPESVELILTKYNSGKKYDKSEFFTLGSDGRDNEEIYQIDRNNNMKINKLRNIIKNKEKNIKYNLFKNFLKFYYNGKYNQKIINYQNCINDIKQIRVFNTRYVIDNQNSQNNGFNGMSIKTLSDNSSSILTDRKYLNLDLDNKIICSNNFTDEEKNKK